MSTVTGYDWPGWNRVIRIEVAYATLHQQTILELEVSDDSRVQQAIELSGIKNHYPEIDLAKNKVGIFGKLTKLDAELHDGDRIEIYRPLIADPKEVRRKRAAEGKKMKKGGGEMEDKTAD